MQNLVDVTEASRSKTIWINLDNVTFLEPDGRGCRIHFIFPLQGLHGTLLVKQNPSEIVAKAYQSSPARPAARNGDARVSYANGDQAP